MLQMTISKCCCFILYLLRKSFHVLETELFYFPPLLAGQEGFQFLNFSPLYEEQYGLKGAQKEKENVKQGGGEAILACLEDVNDVYLSP